MLGGMKKTYFGNRKKCSSQIRPNGQKLVIKLVLRGLLPFLILLPPKMLSRTITQGAIHISR